VASTKQKKRVPVPAPPAPRSRRQASPRVLLGAAAVIVLVVAAVLAIAALRGGGSSTPAGVPAVGSLENGLPGAAETEQLLREIPQRGNVLGSSSAPATLVEYIDLQCPFCQEFEVAAMPPIIRRYVRTGKLKVEMRPIAFIGPDSETGRKAAIAAGDQDKQFNFVQLVYLNQGAENSGWLDDDMITAAAASVPGLRVPELLNERDSSAVADQATVFDGQAKQDHVSQTPTILVGRSGGPLKQVQLSSPQDLNSVTNAVDAALR
jgi:protein-disulfide isomerase